MTVDQPAGCLALPFELVPDDLLAKMGPQPRALLERLNATAHLWRTPEFAVIGRSLAVEVVCTSLHGDDLTARLTAVPSGTSGGWELNPGWSASCPTSPDTHRHLMAIAAIDWTPDVFTATSPA